MTTYTLARCTAADVQFGVCNADSLEKAEGIAEDFSFFERNTWMVCEETSETGLKIISTWLCGERVLDLE